MGTSKEVMEQMINDATGSRNGSQRRQDDWMVGQYLRKTDWMRYLDLVRAARQEAVDEMARKFGLK